MLLNVFRTKNKSLVNSAIRIALGGFCTSNKKFTINHKYKIQNFSRKTSLQFYLTPAYTVIEDIIRKYKKTNSPEKSLSNSKNFLFANTINFLLH